MSEKRLGRGLSALLGDSPAAAAPAKGLRMIALAEITPGKYQPRRDFDDAGLKELADSLKTQGVLQPIVVRRKGERFELVAGERRWRAAQLAKLHEIPAVVREFSDREALEAALVENLQRRDLGPLEEAEAFQRLIDEFGHSQEAIGEAVGKSRSHVANILRVLQLPQDVRALIAAGTLSLGHAKALMTVTNPTALAREIVKRRLTVREAEDLAQGDKPDVKPKTRAKDPNTAALERRIAGALGVKAAIKHRRGGAGSLTLGYKNLDQLDSILAKLGLKS